MYVFTCIHILISECIYWAALTEIHWNYMFAFIYANKHEYTQSV